MCLFIDQNFHKDIIVKTSDSHILTHKVLFTNKDGNLETPYMRAPVKFNNFGIAKLEYKYEIKPMKPIWKPLYFAVEEGIHSYRYSFFGKLLPTNGYCAIIPAGTPYYKGTSGDMVSNKLIIFKNKTIYKIWKLFQFRKIITI